jgi:hypothetical protein
LGAGPLREGALGQGTFAILHGGRMGGPCPVNFTKLKRVCLNIVEYNPVQKINASYLKFVNTDNSLILLEPVN